MHKAFGKRLSGKAANSGQAVIEIIAGIVIFTIMMSLIMSISAYLYFQQALVTAAREGARHASFNSDLGEGGSEQAGSNEVRAYVQNTILQLTGQQASPSIATITVVPPSQSANQTSGRRTVSVNIVWQMKNPIGIAGFLDALGTDGDAFRTFPVYATATMRYEE